MAATGSLGELVEAVSHDQLNVLLQTHENLGEPC